MTILRPEESVLRQLEEKLTEMGPVIGKTMINWPYNLSFDELTPSTWEIIRSRHITALQTLHALKSEIAVLQEVIQEESS